MALSQINFDFDDASTNEASKKNSTQIQPKHNKQPTINSGKLKGTRGRKSLKENSENADLTDIPEDEELFKKSYYSIGDVSTMFKENASLIRYWTNEFTILQPKKNKKGDRFYRPEDVKNLKLIHNLLRERKYTIGGAKDFLKTNKSAGEKYLLIQSLQKLKSFLLELKNSL